VGDTAALALVGGALAVGTFLSTAIGTGLRIRRPARLQAVGFGLVALAGVWAGVTFTLTAVVLFCLTTAIASGLAKLAVDASIQERIPETVRASAFAHAETLLMLAWVAGGAIGLIPLDARIGIALAATAMLAATARGVIVAWGLRGEVLVGKANPAPVEGDAASTRVLDSAGRGGTNNRRATPAPRGASPSAAAPAKNAPVTATEEDDNAPPGYHIFRPSPPDGGVGDPR
jgi:hypothetical protein